MPTGMVPPLPLSGGTPWFPDTIEGERRFMPNFLKDKKKLLILLAGGLVLIVACAGGAWLFLREPAGEAVMEDVSPPPRHKEPF